MAHTSNTVDSNHFHSVKILLFLSARSRDFDGTPGTELPVVNVHNKNSQSICAVLTFDPQLNKIFCKRQISIKLFYLYQRLQCRDKYFFKIKFVFFLYLRLSASSKENDLPLCKYFWYQTDSGVPNTSIYSAASLASPYYNYLWLWYADVVSNIINTGSRLPICSDVKTRKRRNVVGIDMIRNNHIQFAKQTKIKKQKQNIKTAPFLICILCKKWKINWLSQYLILL